MCVSGMIGAEVTHVFCSSGENVRLSCNNALSGCTSTTWIYSRHSVAVELITGGIKKKYIEGHERLSLGSDCSLNIKKVTKEDCRLYSCRQYVNEEQQVTDARVYLHVLHVSSSSSQSEIRSGRSVTLSCQLYYDRVSCDTLVGSEGIDLIWVNQAGVNLQTDSRFQIFSSEQCLSSLTTTLLNEDHNREWRCQVTQRNQLKTSATYTVKYSGVKDSTLIPVSSSNSEKSSQTTAAPTTRVIGIVVAAASAVLLAVVLWVICKKRADNRRGTNDSVFTDKNNGASDSVSRSIHLTPSTNEHKDDVTYTEVATHCTIQARKKEVYDDDKVTYSSIRGATAGPQDDCSQLYASVNKNHHK
ncbi:uncharacterized protein LOC131543572 isoform X2 [Onychostoma macrolepis]|uniref:uncharacterized protein LOC131543572 isoform X2 n=1 Tax=Onychostoma macrolepis TaxID=369639 RepID=UPI00272953E9|nr:uncharacterized protein LOC131543572 isoform X2 [Onychostoma macrolepis]